MVEKAWLGSLATRCLKRDALVVITRERRLKLVTIQSFLEQDENPAFSYLFYVEGFGLD